MAAIVTTDLSKSYKQLGKATVHSLSGLNMEVGENEIFGFLGRNGAGKTTAIKLLTGLIRASRGGAEIFGKDSRLPDARAHIGYLPEHPYFYEYLTPRESLEFYAELRGVEKSRRKSEWLRISEMLDLDEFADRRIRGFSKGMRQRVGLAVSLIGDPPLLILDEPMSGLDPHGRRMVRELMLRLRSEGKTVFFSSHILSDVEEISDRVAILVSGKLAASGRIEDLSGDGEKAIELCCTGLKGEALNALAARGMKGTADEEGRIRFLVPDVDQSAGLITEIQQQGGILLSMVPVLESLEDFFTKLEQRDPSSGRKETKSAAKETESHE
ncbi:MAG: ABC transporter ATP-binding protein [Candidatus Hydrogenedens sp.]|jgi:ABC-2 type transport system ATP-binding protein|nr:ABC transporter ATP-binding protein [Candidatus Hydrogenedens sp.]